ncbi:hypothetical protein ZWY2020_011662 [Hordeum vulgare]|nr:hypothetical protein ZWY2020_011662 [Hordeum vulgare]
MAIALAAFLLLLTLRAVILLTLMPMSMLMPGDSAKAAAPYPLLGHLPQFLANRHRILDWMTEVLARQPTCTLVFHRPGGERGIITANPANLEHAMRPGFHNYPRARASRRRSDFLGHGILNVDGQAWRAQLRPRATSSTRARCASSSPAPCTPSSTAGCSRSCAAPPPPAARSTCRTRSSATRLITSAASPSTDPGSSGRG